MKIVVIGGTGLIGSRLVSILRSKGHEVLAASPDSGVNTITGEGLDAALAGAQVVVDVANSPKFDESSIQFFETSGTHLLAAEQRAGVRHHVALSIVGTDRLPDSAYLRAKMTQENLIKKSGIPYSILRSTQFFEFMTGIANSNTESQLVRLSPALVRPIAAGLSDASAYLVEEYTAAESLEMAVRRYGAAPPADVLRMIVVEGMRPTLLGLVIGVVAAAALGRVLTTLMRASPSTTSATPACTTCRR